MTGCQGNVECANAPDAPYCDTTSGECVQCIENGDCSESGAPLCSPSTKTCVQCNEDSDCSAGGCVENVCLGQSTCDYDTFSPVTVEAATYSPTYATILYTGKKAEDDPTDYVIVEIYYDMNGAHSTVTEPGVYPLGQGTNSDYSTCADCVLVYLNYDYYEGTYDKVFFAAEGNLNVTSLELTEGTTFEGTLDDVTLVEVIIGDGFLLTPVPDGETYCLDNHPFSTLLEVF